MAVLDLQGRVSYCDWFLLCNGSNTRQVGAIAENILQTMKQKHGVVPVGVEGVNTGKWVLLDFGDVLVHVFEAPLRGYYDLDGLWLDARNVPLAELGIDEPEEEREPDFDRAASPPA